MDSTRPRVRARRRRLKPIASTSLSAVVGVVTGVVPRSILLPAFPFVEAAKPEKRLMMAAIHRRLQGERIVSLLVWLLPALLVVAYGTLAVTGRLLYQTYDEPRLADLAEGVLEPNAYACTIVLMHPWLGKAIATLTALVPGVRWFALTMLAAHVVALWRIIDSLRRSGCDARGIVAAASVCVLGYTMIEPGFTTAAALLVAAALFPLLAPGFQELRSWARGWHGVLSLLLLSLGAGYRDTAAILAFAGVCAAFAAVRGREVVHRSPAALRAVAALVGAAAVLGGLTLVGRIVPATPEAARFRAYYQRNVEIADYHRTTYDASWAGPLAMSANDFAMIGRHFVTDSGPFRYDRLAALPANAGRSNVVLAAVSLVRETSLAAWALLAIILLGCFVQPRLALCLCAASAALIAIRWGCDRMPPRVAMPTLALPALVAVASASREGGRSALRWLGAGLVVLIGWFAIESWSTRAYKLRTHQRDEAVAWAFCDSRGIRPFHWGPSGRSVQVFHRPIGSEAEAVRVGSWANSHPSRLKRIHSLVGDDLYAALVQDGSHHVITGAGDRSVVETFLRERGPSGLRMSKLLDCERAVVLRVDVSSDADTTGPDGTAREPR